MYNYIIKYYIIKCLSLNIPRLPIKSNLLLIGKRGIFKPRHLTFLTIYNHNFYRYIYFTCT